MSESNGKLILTAEEVADILQIPKWTVHQLHRRDVLPACRIGRLLRWKRSQIDDYIKNLKPTGKRKNRQKATVTTQGKDADAKTDD